MMTLAEKMAMLEPVRRARIEKEAEKLSKDYQTLQQLRKAQRMTQEQLARQLGVRQATIAQLERRSDLMLSTLRSYVEALGGKLELTVEFPGQTPLALHDFSTTASVEER
jgi:transcriptional regulator with XRE-family HTH domain